MRLALSSISAFMVIATRGQALSTSRGLGLRVFLAKSGAIWFYDKKRREIPSSGLSINMAGETVGVGSPMKNLGLVIDSQFEPHRVGGCQCLVRPAAEHRRGESHGASTIRKRRSVPSDVRGPSMGGRSDSESLQHPASQKAAQGNRYQNRQGIPNGVPRVDDRSDRPPPPLEFRALALARRYAHMRVLDSGEDSTEQVTPNDLKTAEEDAWDQWRFQLINEGSEHRGAETVLPN